MTKRKDPNTVSNRIPIATCGVDAHPIDCLCDVVVREITPINVDMVRDGWCSEEILEYLFPDKIDYWTNETILQFLEAGTMFHDEWTVVTKKAGLSRRDRNRRRARPPYSLSSEQENRLSSQVNNDEVSATSLRVYMKVMWDITITPNQATLLRERLLTKADNQ